VIQRLGKAWYRRRALRIFRDDTSLSATPTLWPSIEHALGNSRFLILLASPEAAASHWVGKEVAWWLDNKSADTFLIALTDGQLAWDETLGDFATRGDTPLPPVLAGRFAHEPKWIDLRVYRDGADARDSRFIEAGADFAAAIHGLPKEDLLSQEVRQQRRALRLAWSAAGTLALLIALAGWQWWEAEGAKRSAQIERDRAVVAERTASEQRDEAQSQRDRAERNFGIATKTADHVVFRIAQDLRDVQGMNVESVRRILETAQAMMDGLAKAAPEDLSLQGGRAGMLSEFSETYTRAGDIVRARAAADEGVLIMRKLVGADPGRPSWRLDLSVLLEKGADARVSSGDRPGALAAYEESLAIRRELVALDPGNTVWRRYLGGAFGKVGDYRLAGGDRKGALTAYGEGLAIVRGLVATDPEQADWRNDLGVSLVRIGDARRAAGDTAGALAAYEESLTVRRKLAAENPGNAQSQRNVTASLSQVGDVKMMTGDGAGALAVYEEGLAVIRKLVSADPGNARWQRELSASLSRVGDARLAMRDGRGALSAFEENLAGLRRLAGADPANLALQRELGVGLNRVGDVRQAARDYPTALAMYEESLALRRKLTTADPGNVEWQRDLSQSLIRVGDIKLAGGDRAGPLAAFDESLAIIRKIAAIDPGNPRGQADLVLILYKVSTVSDPARVRTVLREALVVVEALERKKQLTSSQRSWPKEIRELLAKLPPDTADAQ
jgi:tetratricopeptide (TPR) repeat protein